MVKLLINCILSLVFFGTVHSAEPKDYDYDDYVCRNVVSYYLDYSFSMCDGDRNSLPGCEGQPLGTYGCDGVEQLHDQRDAMDALTAAYINHLSNRQYDPYLEIDAYLSVSKYGDKPVSVVSDTKIDVDPNIEILEHVCLGHTYISKVYRQINDTCNPYDAHICVIFGDMHFAEGHVQPDGLDETYALFEDIKTNCPGMYVLLFQIGHDEYNFHPERMCHGNVTADEFYSIIESPDDYADEFAGIIVDICKEKEKEYIEKEQAKITYPPSTDPPAPIYYQPYEDPPVVISSDSKDGFWWWWILLAAIGALLCCLGGALACKNKRKPELDIQHENMDLPACEDDVVVDDAQIHIRH